MNSELIKTLEEDKTPGQHTYSVTIKRPKKTPKTYKINVTYIPTTEEKARIKLSIVESIIKRTFIK
ncbi:hypothetical protein CA265_20815 [Sphingobacteriaceae bacterium GW460-11-11-14-LB5]|nr:hypothetical protein CA265_20815 [Sphingobacteriaceae bacterium GW460-11-11-14-LB5]